MMVLNTKTVDDWLRSSAPVCRSCGGDDAMWGVCAGCSGSGKGRPVVGFREAGMNHITLSNSVGQEITISRNEFERVAGQASWVEA